MDQTWMSYLGDEQMIMVDARFEKWQPPGFDHLYLVQAPMESPGSFGYGDETEVGRFQPFEDMVHAEAAELDLVAVGRRRGFARWELAWYGPPGQDKRLFKVLRDHPEASLDASLDPTWSYYRENLLPRGKDLHRARNGLVVYQLVEAGDHLDQPRLIEFFVYFHREIDRDRYLRDIGSTGLDANPVDDGDRPGIRAFFTAAIDVELITDITWELHERALQSNGTFDGWGCSPVTGT